MLLSVKLLTKFTNYRYNVCIFISWWAEITGTYMKRLQAFFSSLLLLFALLVPAVPVRSAEANLVSNPSVETTNPSNANLPQYWSKNKWGTNTGSLKYDTTGYTGNRSLHVQLKSISSGDAKWVFRHVPVTPGKTYVFSNYYKSNASTNVVVEAKDNANALSYQWLGSLPTATNWTQGTFEYTAPANVKTVTVLHTLNQVGWLSTDDYSLSLKGTVTPPAPTPPTVGITSPTSGSTVSGQTTVNATATDAVAVAGVQFSVDGANLGAEDTTAPYSVNWDTTTVANGSRSVKAVARNTQGLTTSQTVQVNVNNTVVTPPVNDPTNLLANPSFETADPANAQKPANWTSNSWGTNTPVFSYPAEGRTGSKSVKTELATFADGDAKWFFNTVNSQGNHVYTFKDYYKSNVTTRVVAASYDSAGAATYIDVSLGMPASSTWKEFSGQFSVPANSSKVSVFHLIDKVGWLQVDDAYLGDNGAPTPDTSSIPNGSLETASLTNSNLPEKWSGASWGSNLPSFEYVNEGHTGSKSVKVSMSNYVNGDAKWMFNPVSLERGKQFRFSTWYKTNVTPNAVAMFTKDDGTVQYFGLPNPQPNGSTDWQYYSDTFSVPTNAKEVSVFLFINKNGWLQTDDYNITPYQPTGFNRPLVSLTFDDGHEDNIATALPMLNSYGFKTTHCYATQHVEGQPQQVQNVLAFRDSGHEICSHTVSHPFLTSLNTSNLTYELSHSKDFLQSATGVTVRNFASPYGDYNAAVNNEIKKYYRSHRTVDEGYNSKDNFDIYRLRVQNVQSNTTIAEVQSWIAHAQATNTWLILVYHRVANDPGQFDSYVTDFAAQLQAIQNSGITVKTYNDALDEVTAQL